ncbi:MAG: hypothetical protein PHF79_01930 [Candidatus Pacebacteria bacterium]|nr:hypothetical protein [Candidatus Paceibacterota bacterium]
MEKKIENPDQPRFMNLGAPKSADFWKKMEAKPKIVLVQPPKESTQSSYAFWAFCAVLIGATLGSIIFGSISVGYGALVAARRESGSDNQIAGQTTDQAARPLTPAEKSNQRLAIGSDDGATGTYSLAANVSLPSVSAAAYLVGDIDTGDVVFQKNETFRSPMASVSKLMTAVIMEEKGDLHHEATVSQQAYNTYGTEGELHLGEKINTGDLMYPLLIESSNVGAEVFADDYGRDAFMTLMNQKAAELDMKDTYYDDPSGLSAKNQSTVTDLFKLGRYIWQNWPSLYDMTRIRQFATLKHNWSNPNKMLQYTNFLGGKNGYIDASSGQTTVSLFNVDLARGGKRNLAIVILKSTNRDTDTAKILAFIKKGVEFTPQP